jgi:hypothetical protein
LLFTRLVSVPCSLFLRLVFAPCCAGLMPCSCALLHYFCILLFHTLLKQEPCCDVITSRCFTPCSHTLLRHSHALLFSTIRPCYSHLSPYYRCPTIVALPSRVFTPCYPPFSRTSSPPPHCCFDALLLVFVPCYFALSIGIPSSLFGASGKA